MHLIFLALRLPLLGFCVEHIFGIFYSHRQDLCPGASLSPLPPPPTFLGKNKLLKVGKTTILEYLDAKIFFAAQFFAAHQ